MVVKPGTTRFAVVPSAVRKITGEKPGKETGENWKRYIPERYVHTAVTSLSFILVC